jgi:hypothetical protein
MASLLVSTQLPAHAVSRAAQLPPVPLELLALETLVPAPPVPALLLVEGVPPVLDDALEALEALVPASPGPVEPAMMAARFITPQPVARGERSTHARVREAVVFFMYLGGTLRAAAAHETGHAPLGPPRPRAAELGGERVGREALRAPLESSPATKLQRTKEEGCARLPTRRLRAMIPPMNLLRAGLGIVSVTTMVLVAGGGACGGNVVIDGTSAGGGGQGGQGGSATFTVVSTTATVASGSTTTGGNPMACDQCVNTATFGVCLSADQACGSNPDCVAIAQCHDQCGFQPTCQKCEAANPNGVMDYEVLMSCAVCKSCFNLCRGTPIGDQCGHPVPPPPTAPWP